ncbi:MAG: hypothetical protein IJ730_06890, partial [Alphaproteobacteria bacterium]|nr:hypothetical protein [Alphaproteobacteria bacterium]
DSILTGNQNLIGIKEFSQSQKMSLYEELLSGACKFTLVNKNTNEQSDYISNAVAHISGTDLIKINFINAKKGN